MGFFSNPLKKTKKLVKKLDPVGSKVISTAVKTDRKVLGAGARTGGPGGKMADILANRKAKTGGILKPGVKPAGNTGIVPPKTGGAGQVSKKLTGPLGGRRDGGYGPRGPRMK